MVQTGSNDIAGTLATATGTVVASLSAQPGGANWVLATTTTTNAEWVSINSLIITAGASPWLRTAPYVYLAINSDLVGIGTPIPAEKLEVAGNLRLGGYQDTINATAPATPSAGYLRWYSKVTDKLPYAKDDAGVEYPLVGFTASGSGGPWSGVTYKNLDLGDGLTGFNQGAGSIKLDASIPYIKNANTLLQANVSTLNFTSGVTATIGVGGQIDISASGGGEWTSNAGNVFLTSGNLNKKVWVSQTPLSGYEPKLQVKADDIATPMTGSGNISLVGLNVYGSINYATPHSAQSYLVGIGSLYVSGTSAQVIPLAVNLHVGREPQQNGNTTFTEAYSILSDGPVRFKVSLSTANTGLSDYVAITPSGSPFTFTNNVITGTGLTSASKVNLFVCVQGGTVSNIQLVVNGTTFSTGETQGVFPVRAGAGIIVTYTSAPNMSRWFW